jgi:phosphoserine phosphatase
LQWIKAKNINLEEFVQQRWTSEVFNFLKQVIPSKKGFACFDFDNTMIYHDLGEEVMFSLVKDGLTNLKEDFTGFFRDKEKATSIWKNKSSKKNELLEFVNEEYAFHLNTNGMEAAYRWTSFLFSGLTASELESYSKKIWQKFNFKNSIYPYPEMLSLVKYLKANQWKVAIITASPAASIKSISQFWEIPKDDVIGMELENINGVLSSKIIEPYSCSEGKVKSILQKYNQNPDLAFGDSIGDVPMMLSATIKGILLDRQNQNLLDTVKDNGFLLQPAFYAVNN